MSILSRRQFLKDGALLTGIAGFGLTPAHSEDASAPAPPKTGDATPPAPAPEKKVDPYAGAVFVDGPPPPIAAGAFTVVALPDTQNYDNKYSEGYSAQTRWIVEQKEARKIACVLHLGDITNNNLPRQWENAQRSMKLLDGHVPYFMAPGNHDYSEGGKCSDRTSLFSQYFPVSSFKGRPTTGGFYDREPDRVENSFHLFSAGGRQFIVLCLEFGPRKDVVRWADEVVAKHHDREAILVTHAFTYYDDSRYDFKKFGSKQTWNPHTYGVAKATSDDVTDGEELWQLLVSKHPNFIFTINGHVLQDGLGKTISATPAGREIPQMLVNFQMKPKGGDGWMRLLEFHPDGSLHVCDWSPSRNQRNESPQNKFVLKLAPKGLA